MRVIGAIATWLGGLGFLGFAVAFLIAPDATLASAGMAMTGPGASAELRAFYGAMAESGVTCESGRSTT